MSIILRNVKGSPLTYNELDGNFIILSQSYATTGSNLFNGNQTINGNLIVLGTASFINITASNLDVSSSFISVNVFTPVERFGGLKVFDSGSVNNTASFAWDSLNNHWVYQNVSGAAYNSAIFIAGPKNTGSLGNEPELTQYYIPVAQGGDHIGNSTIYNSGSRTIVTGSVFINPFLNYPAPSLGTGSGGFYLGGDDGAYGLYMGVSSSGTTWIQANRNDGLALAYNMSLQPIGGNVNIGKLNPATSGPKLDISGSTVITGSLDVTGGITGNLTGTASYASIALSSSYAITSSNSLLLNGLNSSQFVQTTGNQTIADTKTFDSPVILGVDDSLTGNGKLTFNTIDSFSVGVNVKASIAGGQIPTSSVNTEFGDLLFLDNNNDVLAGLYQDGTGFKMVSGSFIGDLIGTASFASTASFVRNAVSASYILNAISSSYALSSSYSRNSLLFNNTASTVFATINSNNFVGTQNINGNVNITGSLVTSGSSTFRNIGLAEMTGSLLMNTLDGRSLFRASSSLSSSISSSIEGTTASFNGTGFAVPEVGTYPWNSDFYLYYAGTTGSGETNISPAYTASKDNQPYDILTLGFNDGITLSPSGSISKYDLYLYNPSDTFWYKYADLSKASLMSGIPVSLTGDTETTLGTDLQAAGFAKVSDPSSNVNNITYVSQSLLTFTSSLFNINTPLTVSSSFTSIGNVTITGSLTVSGSTILTNVGTATFSGSTNISGSTTLRGTTVVTGSFYIASSSGDFYIYGNKQGNYGVFQDLTTQSGSANISQSFKLNTIDEAVGVIVTGSLSSSLYFQHGGTYDIQFSAQLFTATGANVAIWLKKNGVNMPGTAGRILTSNNDYRLPSWNYVLSLVAGDTIDIAWQSDQTNTQFQYISGSGNIPSAASIIVSATQVR